MTNLEYIQEMDVKEMLNFLEIARLTPCELCSLKNDAYCIEDYDNCEKGRKKWLEQEAKEIMIWKWK